MASFKIFSRHPDGSGVIMVNLDHVISAEMGSISETTVLKLAVELDGKKVLGVGHTLHEVAKMLGVHDAQGT